MTKQTILYHGGCPDGFGSAWWLGKHIGEHTKFAAYYDQPPPVGLEGNVWIVDFCYPPGDLATLADGGASLVVMDHHQTADGWLAEYSANIDVPVHNSVADWADSDYRSTPILILDQNHSGVGIVVEWCRSVHASRRPPQFLANLEDRDLWRFKHDDTKDIFAAVTARPYTEEVWDELAAMPHEELVIEGRAINLYRDRLIEQVAASTFMLLIGNRGNVQVGVQCATSPYAIGSDVAGLIAEQSKPGIGAYAILHQDNVQIGLRSRGSGPDVAFLAEQHGGGGHKHASGLRFSYDEFYDRLR